MSETRKKLEQIRDLLKSDPPDTRQALRLVKNIFLHGICSQASERWQRGAVLLLESLVLPALVGSQEQQAHVRRLIRRMQTAHTLNPQVMGHDLPEIAVWLAQLDALVESREPPPPFAAALLQTALVTLGGKPVQEMVASDKKPEWERLYLHLGAIIHQEQRWREAWQEEQERLQTLLAGTTRILAEALRLIGADATDLTLLSDRLRTGEAVNWAACSATLLQATQTFQERAVEMRHRLTTVQETVERSRLLVRHADWALMETRDEKLMDMASGLPNRFGLLARLEQAKQLTSPEGFTLIVIMLEDYAGILRDLGRERVGRLMGALAGRMLSLTRPGEYLARFNEETFVLLSLKMPESEAVASAGTWRTTLDNTRFELSDARLTVRTSYGIACYEQGDNTETLLGLATMAAQEALTAGDTRIRSVPSRQKKPPPPTPPPFKRRFGFR